MQSDAVLRRHYPGGMLRLVQSRFPLFEHTAPPDWVTNDTVLKDQPDVAKDFCAAIDEATSFIKDPATTTPPPVSSRRASSSRPNSPRPPSTATPSSRLTPRSQSPACKAQSNKASTRP
jgi:hypothetical protein